MIIKLETYGQIISDNKLGTTILNNIENSLKENDSIILDFSNVKSMATYNAKQIFGQLYIKLGSSLFFKKIAIKNATPSIQAIIKLGINDSIKKVRVI